MLARAHGGHMRYIIDESDETVRAIAPTGAWIEFEIDYAIPITEPSRIRRKRSSQAEVGIFSKMSDEDARDAALMATALMRVAFPMKYTAQEKLRAMGQEELPFMED